MKKKIAIIKCSGSVNYGNDFINAGGIFLLHKLFEGCSFYEYEFSDSASGLKYEYPGYVMPSSSLELINTCDITFILSGSIINAASDRILNILGEKIKTPKILLGASAAGYCDREIQICTYIKMRYDYVFLRDYLTKELYFSDCEKAKTILDLAFFVGEFLNIPRESADSTKYAIVNIDDISEHQSEIKAEVSRLKKLYKEVFIVENTSRIYSNLTDYMHVGCWQSLYTLYTNASYVVTNRVHTSVVCTAEQTPFTYVGLDCSSANGKRSALFQTIGMALEHGKTYTADELKTYESAIAVNRRETLRAISDNVTV